MSDEEMSPQQGQGGEPAEEMSEEQMKARMEEQLRQIRVQDVVAESSVSIINLTARRIGKEDERDLEQARVGIEAVRALLELVEGELQEQLRSALSEIQMMYAREAGTAAPGAGDTPGAGDPTAAPQQPTAAPQQPGAAPQGPGAAPQGPGGGEQPKGDEPPSRLWTPGR